MFHTKLDKSRNMFYQRHCVIIKFTLNFYPLLVGLPPCFGGKKIFFLNIVNNVELLGNSGKKIVHIFNHYLLIFPGVFLLLFGHQGVIILEIIIGI